MHFEATEENKLIYMDIFKKYVDTSEAFITEVGSPCARRRSVNFCYLEIKGGD